MKNELFRLNESINDVTMVYQWLKQINNVIHGLYCMADYGDKVTDYYGFNICTYFEDLANKIGFDMQDSINKLELIRGIIMADTLNYDLMADMLESIANKEVDEMFEAIKDAEYTEDEKKKIINTRIGYGTYHVEDILKTKTKKYIAVNGGKHAYKLAMMLKNYWGKNNE